MKSYTDIEQSKKLAEILPLESADMCFNTRNNMPPLMTPYSKFNEFFGMEKTPDFLIPCWSLAALLEYMNRNFYNISLNYCGSEYSISFDDNEKYKTITKDYSIDAVFEMVIWLKENNRL